MRRIARRSWLGGLRASKRLVELPVHPGRDWFTVLSGTVLVLLGERTIRVEPGQAAEFSTMVPHAFGAQGGPAVIIAILDPDGKRSHLRTVSFFEFACRRAVLGLGIRLIMLRRGGATDAVEALANDNRAGVPRVPRARCPRQCPANDSPDRCAVRERSSNVPELPGSLVQLMTQRNAPSSLPSSTIHR